MFEGRYSVAVSPEGVIALPAAMRREVPRIWGKEPALLCFGVQFLYFCHIDQAEALLRCIDERICAVFPKEDRQVIAYLHALEHSVARPEYLPGGRIALPPSALELLGAAEGKLPILLGVDDHLELWNRDELQDKMQQLAQKSSGERTPSEQLLLETPICLQNDDMPCSLLKDGRPTPKRCGPCVYLRLP